MNRYVVSQNIVNFKKDFYIAKIEKIIHLMEQRNEVYLFENQNIFRHSTIFEKIQSDKNALKILNDKEKQWLKKDKNGNIKNDLIYIFIADTISSLYNNFPTNKNIKRAIVLSIELIAIKIMLSSIYSNRQKEDLLDLSKNLKDKHFNNVEELNTFLGFDKKLNPEVYKFVKNWTRSITFDVKVKISSFVLNMKKSLNKNKKRNKDLDTETLSCEVLLTREEIFEDIAERLFEYALNNFYLEEFKFLSARLINKKEASYAKVLVKRRVFDNIEQIDEFVDRIEFMMEDKNNYLSNDYKKYNSLFPKGVIYGLQKATELRRVDYYTMRVLIDMFLINSVKTAIDDAYLNFKLLTQNFDCYKILFGLMPYKYIDFKLNSLKRYPYKGEQVLLGQYNLKEFISENIRLHSFKGYSDEKLGVFKDKINEDSLINFKSLLVNFVNNNENIKKELLVILKEIESDFKKEFNKKKCMMEIEEKEKIINLIKNIKEVL